jgi:hypothetical protein
MNILGLVFALLLILSYGFFAAWEKHTALHRLQSTYLGHERASRTLFNRYQSEVYRRLRSEKKPPSNTQKKKTASLKPRLNPECAKLNLYPLINEGRESHPFLYEMAAKMLRLFYSKPLFGSRPRFEYSLLDQILTAAKVAQQKEGFALEKLELKDQITFYKMLKGTREWNLKEGIGYPSLLDYLKMEKEEEKICLFHAHPDLIAVLFNLKAADKIYMKIQEEKTLSKETIERLCSEAHLIALDPALFEMIHTSSPSHDPPLKKTFVAEDASSQVFLKRSIYIR